MSYEIKENREVVEMLHAGGCSCVIRNRGEVRTFSQRGVADLFALLGGDGFLRGAFVADKVVGKAAAMLMAAGGVSGVYAGVLSEQALPVLRRAGVELDFGRLVPYIENRAGDGWCPLEMRCRQVLTNEEGLDVIRKFIGEIAAKG